MDELVLPITEDMRCPFLTEDKRCEIHENRPKVCRIYGYGENPCPYLRSDGRPRSEGGVRRYYANGGFPVDECGNLSIFKTYEAGDFDIIANIRLTYVRVGERE